MNKSNSLFISNPVIESLFILLPPFLSVLLAFVFYHFTEYREMTPVLWLLVVLLVDVSHVWTTIFRTYFNKQFFKDRSDLLIYVPLGSFIIGVLLYSVGRMIFWRVIAYIAVFHFIRQQYGIFMLYARKSEQNRLQEIVGKVCIYLATLAPVVHWHLNLPRSFSWFIEGDFFALPQSNMGTVMVWFFTAVTFLFYIFLEIKSKRVNWQKNLVLLGTLLSWSVGIVLFNNDVSFTLTNVLTHGIPYFALVWMSSCQSDDQKEGETFEMMKIFTKPKVVGIVFMIVVVAILGFVEEFFWDTFVWHEHQVIFSWLYDGVVNSDEAMLTLFVPLLSVPQVTHYILDGFIWKGKQSYHGLRF